MPTIRPYSPEDWPAVERIYGEGIATRLATFETRPKSQQAWENSSVPRSGIVCVDHEDAVLGWAILWPVSDRCAYAGVAEVSVYVAGSARGRGVGKMLLTALASTSEQLGLWTIQAGIFTENTASIALHEKCGFRRIGIREKVGALHGEWKDIMFMERRSKTIGI